MTEINARGVEPAGVAGYEGEVLMALAKEHAEARRPVPEMIVMAAMNARTDAQHRKVMAACVSLATAGHVRKALVGSAPGSSYYAWEVTPSGHTAARQAMAIQAPSKPAPEPAPMESGFKGRRGRDTLRQSVGGAPRPVTRPAPAPARPVVKDSLTTDEPAVPAASEGAVRDHFADVSKMVPPLPGELLERCAVMHLTLLAQSREALDAGRPGAEQELAWLLETGQQLLVAGERTS